SPPVPALPAPPAPVPAVVHTSPAPLPPANPPPYLGPPVHGGFATMPSGLPAPPDPAPARVRQPLPTWVSTTATAAGVLLVLLTLGCATWLVLLGYAVRRRSWRLGVATAGYLGSASWLVYLFSRGDPEVEAPASEAFLALGLMAVCWLVGAVHVILLNARVWGAVTGRPVGLRARDAERRVRREQARYLLHHHPEARHQLRIGRPDLSQVFDDGGLVDINAVEQKVIAGLPGITAGQAGQVAMDRWLRGPYGSIEELAARCMLPPALTDSLRDILVFLPPSPPEQS
ncbi:MAG: transcriptional regulator, partial [Micromonospora sp.]